MFKSLSRLLFVFLLLPGIAAAEGPIKIIDASGHTLVLNQPARRVISLAPNLTELMYAIDAGDRLVAVSDYSDYPQAAKKLPRIGNANSTDVERILAFKPDLILTWKTGTPTATQEYLRRLKLPVFELEFRKIDEIPGGMEVLGELTGKVARANSVAREFRSRLNGLRKKYEGRESVSVFYQVWDQPLMTVNSDHYISDLIKLCGGRNVFADLHSLVSVVDIESVIGRSPEAIISAIGDNRSQQRREQWSRWKIIPAVKNNNIFSISPDLLSRPGPRVLQGAGILCRDLEAVRSSN